MVDPAEGTGYPKTKKALQSQKRLKGCTQFAWPFHA